MGHAFAGFEDGVGAVADEVDEQLLDLIASARMVMGPGSIATFTRISSPARGSRKVKTRSERARAVMRGLGAELTAEVTPRRWCSAEALQRRIEAGPRRLQRGVGPRLTWLRLSDSTMPSYLANRRM
jgi:hypothetical protein